MEGGLIKPLIPPSKRSGIKRPVDIRAVVNALMHGLNTSCQWWALPKDRPARRTVYYFFDLWDHDRTLLRIHHVLFVHCREKAGREARPTAVMAGFERDMLFAPVTLGVALPLFIGKQLGVFGFVLAAVKLRLAQRPAHTNWAQVYGLFLLCGVGFTMSLFIGLLAFSERTDLEAEAKIGVLIGSLTYMTLGALVLWITGRKRVEA